MRAIWLWVARKVLGQYIDRREHVYLHRLESLTEDSLPRYLALERLYELYRLKEALGFKDIKNPYDRWPPGNSD